MFRSKTFGTLIMGLLGTVLIAPARAEFDQYGGYVGIKGQQPSAGFFTVEKIGNRWWLVTPDGHAFINLSVSVVAREPNDGKDRHGRGYADYVRLRYGGPGLSNTEMVDRWAHDTARRLRAWGFNTIGTFSHDIPQRKLMPYYLTLRLSNYAIIHDGPSGLIWDGIPAGGPFPDIYHPEFLPFIDQRMATYARHKDDPWVLGLFIDQMDELRGFDADHVHLGYAGLMGLREISRHNKEKTQNHFKAVFIQFMQQRHETIAALNQAWGTSYGSFEDLWDQRPDPRFGTATNPRIDGHPRFREDLDTFEEKVAADYTQFVTETVRRHDPNHLLFSVNFSRDFKETVVRGMAKAGGFDVYMAGWGADAYEIVQRPMMGTSAGGFLSADHDSPLRFEGEIDRVELVQSDRWGEVIKVWDHDADIWWEHRGNVLNLRFLDLPVPRETIERPWAFQMVGTGKDEDGRSFFLARSSGGYRAGHPRELVEQINAELTAGRKPRYERNSFGDLKTQADRAAAWEAQLQRIIDDRSHGGDHYRVGLNWWKLSDNGWTYWLERYNFGLVTLKGNAYDGREATRLGADGIPGTWDDEDADYGDLLTGVTRANKGIYQRILEQTGE